MTDNENTSDVFASLMQPRIVQLRRITEGMAGMTRLGESALSQPLRSLQALPLPGVLSAAQLDSFAPRPGRAAQQHRGAAGTAGRVRRAAGDAGGDGRPARRVEQDMGRVRKARDEPAP